MLFTEEVPAGNGVGNLAVRFQSVKDGVVTGRNEGMLPASLPSGKMIYGTFIPHTWSGRY
jgi:hypothetical protein